AVGAVKHMPAEHEQETGDARRRAFVVIIEYRCQSSRQGAGERDGIGMDVPLIEDRDQPTADWMDQVTIGEFLNLNRPLNLFFLGHSKLPSRRAEPQKKRKRLIWSIKR